MSTRTPAITRTGRCVHLLSADQDTTGPEGWALCGARTHRRILGWDGKPSRKLLGRVWCDDCLQRDEAS